MVRMKVVFQVWQEVGGPIPMDILPFKVKLVIFGGTSLQVTFFTHNAQFFMNTGFPREGRSVRCVRD